MMNHNYNKLFLLNRLKMPIKSLAVFISVILFFSIMESCTVENEEEYFGESICDSTKVIRDTIEVYYEDLTYIFSGICMTCHNSEFTRKPGILLDTYDNVKATVKTGKLLPAMPHIRIVRRKRSMRLNRPIASA